MKKYLIAIIVLFVLAAPVRAQVYLPLMIKNSEMPAYPPPNWAVLPPCPGVAPPETFARVGETADLYGYGMSGRVTVAGLQTIILRNFSYDGSAGTVDIRLVNRGDYENPVAKYDVLGCANGEWFRLCIPGWLRRGDADRIAVFSFTEGVRGVAIFAP